MNSNATNQMKNNWNVLPFHMSSKEDWTKTCAEPLDDGSNGLRKYRSANGTANAINGKILIVIFEWYLSFFEFE
jgi:hypothetical protein